MPTFETVIDVSGEQITIQVSPDGRLKKTARWKLHEGVVKLRVPPHLVKKDIDLIIERIQTKITRKRRRVDNYTDETLSRRANEINALYFGGELAWRSIRWVDNMAHRLGSCTNGGPSDGDIRLSSRIKGYPDYVVDYVIAHELCHRKYPNHSAAYWDYLARYPHTEKAKGFIEGVFFASGGDPNAALD